MKSRGAARGFAGEFCRGVAQGAVLLLWAALLLPLLHLFCKMLVAAFLATGEFLNAPSLLGHLVERGGIMLSWGLNSLAVVAVSVAVALLVAFLVARTRVAGRRSVLLLLAALACTPMYVTATAWVHVFGQATLTSALPLTLPALGKLVVPCEAVQVLSAGCIMGIAYAPLAALLAAAGMAATPRELEEDALLHGGWLQVARCVTLPLSVWSLAGAGLLVAVLTSTEITATDAVWARTYAEQVYLSFHVEHDLGGAALTALPLVAFFAIGCKLLAPYLRRFAAIPLSRVGRECMSFDPGGWRVPAAVALALICALALLPLADLGAYSFRHNLLAGMTVKDYLAEQCDMAVSSLGLAMSGAFLAVAAAAPLAWLLRLRRNTWLERTVGALLLCLVAFPASVVALGTASFWNSDLAHYLMPDVAYAVYDSPIVAILYYAARTCPVAYLILRASFSQIAEDMLDAARVDGADYWSSLLRIALRSSRLALALAWLACYLISLADVGGSFVISLPSLRLYSITFINLIHNSTVYGELGRMVFAPLFLSLAPVVLIYLLLRRARG